MGRLAKGVGWFAGLTLVACGHKAPVVELQPAVAAIPVRKSMPPSGAQELGKVRVTDGQGCGYYGRRGTLEGAIARLKHEAARHGANYVFVTSEVEPHMDGDCYDQRWIVKARLFAVRRVLQ